nr:MAG TPA: hypothetical protein [Caudoviricetes sp.]
MRFWRPLVYQVDDTTKGKKVSLYGINRKTENICG